jgi:hypothetical protein
VHRQPHCRCRPQQLQGPEQLTASTLFSGGRNNQENGKRHAARALSCSAAHNVTETQMFLLTLLSTTISPFATSCIASSMHQENYMSHIDRLRPASTGEITCGSSHHFRLFEVPQLNILLAPSSPHNQAPLVPTGSPSAALPAAHIRTTAAPVVGTIPTKHC